MKENDKISKKTKKIKKRNWLFLLYIMSELGTKYNVVENIAQLENTIDAFWT